MGDAIGGQPVICCRTMLNEAYHLHSAARAGSEHLSEIDLIRFCEIFSGGPPATYQ
jgi:hypothetical protein